MMSISFLKAKKNACVFIEFGAGKKCQIAAPDECLLHGMRDWNELGGKDVPSLDLSATVDDAEGAGADLLEDVVVVVHALLGLDVHRLRDVLGVNVEHKLVVVLDLAFLTADLLSSLGID